MRGRISDDRAPDGCLYQVAPKLTPQPVSATAINAAPEATTTTRPARDLVNFVMSFPFEGFVVRAGMSPSRTRVKWLGIERYQVAPTFAEPPQAVSVTAESATAEAARKTRPRNDWVIFFMRAVPFDTGEVAPALCDMHQLRIRSSNGSDFYSGTFASPTHSAD